MICVECKAVEDHLGVGGVGEHGPAGEYLGLVVDRSQERLELTRLAHRVAHTALGEQLQQALEEVVDVSGRDVDAPKVALAYAAEMESRRQLVGDELERLAARAAARRRAELGQRVHGLMIGLETLVKPGACSPAQQQMIRVKRVLSVATTTTAAASMVGVGARYSLVVEVHELVERVIAQQWQREAGRRHTLQDVVERGEERVEEEEHGRYWRGEVGRDGGASSSTSSS